MPFIFLLGLEIRNYDRDETDSRSQANIISLIQLRIMQMFTKHKINWFNGTRIWSHLVLFHAWRFGNRIHCTIIFTYFVLLFLKKVFFLHTILLDMDTS